MSDDYIIKQAEKERDSWSKEANYRKDENYRGTETSDNNIKEPLLDRELTYQEVEDKVEAFLPNSKTALKLVLAVAISAVFKNIVMLWMLIVGEPSSGKTDLVRLIKDAVFTYFLDSLTLNAFVSGERNTKKEPVHDLLPQLNEKCFAVKDWTAIFSLDEKATKKLLGDLVNIYDKEFNKFSGRRGKVDYTFEFSHIGCITPLALNKHTNYLNMIGARFFFYTPPNLTDEQEEENYDLILSEDENARKSKEKEARLYVSSYLTQLAKKEIPKIKPLSTEAKNYLKIASKLMANCRGIAILQSATFKDNDKEITYYEVQGFQIERPWRAAYQLKGLVKFLAIVTGKDEVGIDELKIIKEVVISSMPADRSEALRELISQGGELTVKELTDQSKKSNKTSRRLLEELVALDVLEKIKGSGIIAADYQINERFRDFLLLTTAEFLSNKEDDEDFIKSLGYEDKDE